MGALLALSLGLSAQVGDPQIGTDHPYFPGEKAMSTPARVRDFSNAVPRGTLTAANDREKLIRLFLWRAEHFSHALSPSIYNLPGVTPDPSADNGLMIDYDAMRSLFSYGFGLCGTNHGQMRAFIEPFGWTDRRRGLQGDTGYEVYVDGAWRYVNTDQYTLHFLTNSPTAHFASLDEVVTTAHRYIEWNPDLGMGYRLPQANTHGSYANFSGATGTVANRSLQWRDYYQNVWNIAPASSIKMYGEGYTAAPVSLRLRRGESFTRWLSPDGVVNELGLAGRIWWGFTGSGGPVVPWSFVQNAPARDETPGGAEESLSNQRHGNGCFDWQPSLAAGEHLDGAAAVTGTLTAGGAPALRSTGASTLVLEHYTPYTIAGRPADGSNPANSAVDGALITANASGSVAVEVSVNAGATWASAGTLSGIGSSLDFTNAVKGRNQYLLRLSFDNGEGLDSLRVRTITMLNAAVYPTLKDGTTQLSYAAGNTGSMDLSPDLWDATRATSTTGYVVKDSDSGNLNPVHYSGSSMGYTSTNNQPMSAVYRITLPPALASAGALWKDVSAAMNFQVRNPPSGGPYGRIEVGSSAGGPWTQIANYAPPADGELSSAWVYGRSTGTLGGTVRYVKFTAYNGGYTAGIRFLRLYGTYSLSAAPTATQVSCHWNNGSEQSHTRTIAAGVASDSWSVSTGSNVAQRKVVIRVASSAATDTDGDGMTDAFEASKGFDGSVADEDANGTADGNDDWDGDTVLNKNDATPGTVPAPAAPAGGGGGSGGGGGCGALGAEALLAALLLRLRRRSK